MSFIFTGPNVPLNDYLDSVREQAVKQQNPEYNFKITKKLELIQDFIGQEPKYYIGFMLIMAIANGATMGELAKKHGYHREFMVREISKTKTYIRKKMFFRTKGED